MALLRAANTALAFILELCALAALGYWGVHTGQRPLAKIGLGMGAPLLMAVVWGVFLAPRAARPVPEPWHMFAAMAVFAVAALALYSTGQTTLAWIFAVVSVVNLVLAYIWKQ